MKRKLDRMNEIKSFFKIKTLNRRQYVYACLFNSTETRRRDTLTSWLKCHFSIVKLFMRLRFTKLSIVLLLSKAFNEQNVPLTEVAKFMKLFLSVYTNIVH